MVLRNQKGGLSLWHRLLKAEAMKKVTDWPIGLGMNHLEQETSAARLWNAHIDAGNPPDTWANVSDWRGESMFTTNFETGKSLENQGFIEVSGDKFRLTPKAIKLLTEFTENQ